TGISCHRVSCVPVAVCNRPAGNRRCFSLLYRYRYRLLFSSSYKCKSIYKYNLSILNNSATWHPIYRGRWDRGNFCCGGI
ncbi:MAG: hypothetical protein KKE91_04030, partial [Candidatus Omnitrophica bacterium]|nr:hypothetical protein [Candidatus Omnitrophota bacterium]